MSVLIGSARHDENGNYVGGERGDQLQKIGADGLDHSGEVSVQNFYNHKKGWVVIRAKNVDLANGIAFSMIVACNNVYVGYNQYENIKILKDGVTSKIPTNCDCSKLIEACIEQSGYDVPSFTTANEASVLEQTGLFTVSRFTKESDLRIGDILCTMTKGHTVAVVGNAPYRSANTSSKNPYKEPSVSVTSVANAKAKGISKYESKGEGVKWTQWELCQVSADFKREIDKAGGIDGNCGDVTTFLIGVFQDMYNIKADGISGKDTRAALKAN